MPFELVGYEVLKQSVRESIKTEIEAHHAHHTVNIDKLEESIPLLHLPRKAQAQWLLKMISLIDALQVDVKKKAGILNAAVLYIREQIFQTYKVASASRSGFYQSLTASLGINQQNKPDLKAEFNLYLQLKMFMLRHTYKNGNPTSGYIDDAPLLIKDYDLEAELTALTRRVADLEVRCMQEAYEHKKALQVDSTQSRGVFGSIFGSAVPKESSARVEDESLPAKSL